MNHTEGRLAANDDWIGRETGGIVAIMGGFDGITNEANARRLVACWNALEPYPTELIEKDVDSMYWHRSLLQQQIDRLEKENATLKAENDRLRNAAKPVIDYWFEENENKTHAEDSRAFLELSNAYYRRRAMKETK